MPELPETETIARDLDAAIRDAVVTRAELLRADVMRPRAGGARRLRSLERATVRAVRRRAKSILLVTRTAEGDERTVVVTPRFTGALLVNAAPDPRYDCLRLTLDRGRTLTYRDVRRLGTVAVLGDAALADWEAALGPEPLDPALDDGSFTAIIRGSARAVKRILMDQRRLAGIGNIYANEVLWRARIAPARRGDRVTRAEAVRLLAELRTLLEAAIAARGTTFRDYRDAHGGRGTFAAQLVAYGHGGDACARCRAVLRASHAMDGRQTVWCPGCQA